MKKKIKKKKATRLDALRHVAEVYRQAGSVANTWIAKDWDVISKENPDKVVLMALCAALEIEIEGTVRCLKCKE